MKKGKIQQNLDYLLEQSKAGREHCFKSELPFPESANRCEGYHPVLAVTPTVIYLKISEGM